jgi:hypothetical protein
MSENIENELKAAGPNGRVIPTHSTAVDKTSAWDRTAQFRKMRSPATPSYFNEVFAFQLPNTKGDRKTHYSFIHHYISNDGEPGAASMRALSNSVAVLNGGRNGTVLRGSAREGVYRHIAAHYRDADMEAPELKSDEDVDAVMMFKGLIDAPLAETLDLTVKGLEDLDNIIDTDSTVAWVDGDQEIKGIVIEADDDTALVEELDEKGERTGEFYELDYAEIKLRTFVVMEKVDQEAEVGSIVSWDTSNGRYYGDVVAVETEGSLRGEPQGLELEGSEENPVYLIRVWMQESEEYEEDEGEDEEMEEDSAKSAKSAKSEGEWHSTNVTVVARGGALRVEEALPTGDTEEDYDDESEDEETPMKSIDPEFRAQVKRIIEENSEILARLAELDVEEKSAEEATVEETEVKADETITMEVALDEQKADAEIGTKSDEVVETEQVEVKSEEVAEEAAVEEVVEEAKSEEVVAEEAPAAEEVAEEKASISFDELKEFHLLLKEFNK